MNLIIDVGNSYAKLAVFQAYELVEKLSLAKSDFQKELEKLYFRFPSIEKVIFSSVAEKPVEYKEILFRKDNVLILNPSTKLPFKNCYISPETLGNDRKALVAAAVKDYSSKNTLIIDAGTCLTFDFKNDKNEYLGGGISPGLQMRFRALHTFTANLPFLEPTGEVSLVGNSTEASIKSGVIIGMKKEILGIIDDYQALYEDLTIIFTGGDAHFLSINLKNGIFANSNFLLEGLNFILEFNNSQ